MIAMTRTTGPALLLSIPAAIIMLIAIMAFERDNKHNKTTTAAISCSNNIVKKACVFKTFIGLESFDTSAVRIDSRLIDNSVSKGIGWLLQAQQTNGGWGAGTHSAQHIRDPHAVPADPASTALVAMAMLRTSQQPFEGKYAAPLKKALNFLLVAAEQSSDQTVNITHLTNTQPQSKLGQNIDVILTAQFFSNLLHRIANTDPDLKKRIEAALQKCVQKIQKGQDGDGGWKDGGWAPVLQSALANNALESAQGMGAKVDDKVLQRSRDYQKSNYDVKTNSAVTGKAAGVLLYSVSSSARASAKEARMAKEKIQAAKNSGKLDSNARVTEDNLVKAGLTRPEAQKYLTAYEVQVSSAKKAQASDVESGFGSNGGEEFLSYLMTGESLIIGSDNEWKKWYEKMSGRLVQIQNNDGSWNGHHCITSPVVCTATCLLILSIDKDMDFLVKLK
jgi:hypothetical protein